MSAKFKRRVIIALSLILPATPLTQTPAQAKSSSADKSWNKDEQTLRDQARQYALYFEAGDADSLADMWLPNGTLVDGDGKEYRGHDAIAQMFKNYFKDSSRHALSVDVTSVRRVAPTVAIEEGVTRLRDNPRADSIVHYSVTHVKQKGAWRMATAVETIEHLTPEPLSDKLSDLDWLCGQWKTSGSSRPIQLKAAWVPNQKFIKCTFNENDAVIDNDIQILGWNPRSAQVNVWNFAPDGGFGYGRLIRTSENIWTERANSLQSDGTICSATYTITKLTDNRFTWQSTNRSRNSREVPDTPVLTVQRVGN